MPAAARDRFVSDLIALMQKHRARLVEHDNPLHPGVMTYRIEFDADDQHERLGFGRLYDSLRIFGLATIDQAEPETKTPTC